MAIKHKMEEMTPAEFREAVSRRPVFILPTGILEWHADHLPLGLDALEGAPSLLHPRLGGCERIAACGDVAEHADQGTLSLSKHALTGGELLRCRAQPGAALLHDLRLGLESRLALPGFRAEFLDRPLYGGQLIAPLCHIARAPLRLPLQAVQPVVQVGDHALVFVHLVLHLQLTCAACLQGPFCIHLSCAAKGDLIVQGCNLGTEGGRPSEVPGPTRHP